VGVRTGTVLPWLQAIDIPISDLITLNNSA